MVYAKSFNSELLNSMLMFLTKEIVTLLVFFFQAEVGIRDVAVIGVQTCALPI